MLHFTFEYWVFTFCAYCIIGWVQESIIESAYNKKLINRGFLKGPYIPIYGVGGLLLLIICEPFRANPFFVFTIAMISCTTLEYFTGWFMETVFGRQFWDYSMFRITYKNRISLVSSLFWGVMGLFVTYFISGATVYVLERLPHMFICVFGTAVSLIMTFDFFIALRKNVVRRSFFHRIGFSNVPFHFSHLSRLKEFFRNSGDDTEDNDDE